MSKQKKNIETSSVKEKKTTDWIKISTYAIAIATAINTFVAFLMWGQTQKSIDLNTEQMNLAYRPYLSVSRISPEFNPRDSTFHIIAEYKNFGSTPAVNIEFDWNTQVGDRIGV